MFKLEAIIRPNKFEQVKAALEEIGVDGMTISEVRGCGRQKGHRETYRGHEYEVALLPKLRLDVVIDDDRVESVIDAIAAAAGTGEIGDGKIFLFRAEDAVRIRNRQRGVVAI